MYCNGLNKCLIVHDIKFVLHKDSYITFILTLGIRMPYTYLLLKILLMKGYLL